MTEANLARIQEHEREARSALIDIVNKYFNGLNLSDEYQVGFATTPLQKPPRTRGCGRALTLTPRRTLPI